MRRPLVIAGVALCALFACGAPPADGAQATGSHVIGGAVASAEQFPATVYLRAGCTGAKVGPRHVLTAAHCLIDPATHDPAHADGSFIELTHDPSKGYARYAVASTHVTDAWTAECAKTYCGPSEITAKLDAGDVGLLIVDRDIEGIATARIDDAALAVGDDVLLVGFGCTEGIYVPSGDAPPELRYQKTKIVPVDHVLHDGSYIDKSGIATVDASYALTDGPGRGTSNAGLCPGDSGGPLYRDRDGEFVIVGVNSNYTVGLEANDPTGLPMTNWHARVDATSRFQVGVWLAGLLSNTTSAP